MARRCDVVNVFKDNGVSSGAKCRQQRKAFDGLLNVRAKMQQHARRVSTSAAPVFLHRLGSRYVIRLQGVSGRAIVRSLAVSEATMRRVLGMRSS